MLTGVRGIRSRRCRSGFGRNAARFGAEVCPLVDSGAVRQVAVADLTVGLVDDLDLAALLDTELRSGIGESGRGRRVRRRCRRSRRRQLRRAAPVRQPAAGRRGGASDESIGSADLDRAVTPVLVAQTPLVQLARGQPREFVDVVDGSGHLLARQVLPGRTRAVPPSARRSASTPGMTCTTALTSSPRSSLGTPKTAASATLGWVINRFSISCG